MRLATMNALRLFSEISPYKCMVLPSLHSNCYTVFNTEKVYYVSIGLEYH